MNFATKSIWSFLFASIFTSSLAMAQVDISANPLMVAFKDGIAYGAMPANKLSEVAVQRIHAATGSPGIITIRFDRILKFKQQPNCGRISFAPYQESTKTFYGQMGAQINICEDGSPPLRICTNAPDVLVPSDSICSDKSKPVDTPEITKAINDAVSKGGLTPLDIHNRLTAAAKARNDNAGAINEK